MSELKVSEEIRKNMREYFKKECGIHVTILYDMYNENEGIKQ